MKPTASELQARTVLRDLRKRRLSLNLTQRQVAERIGISAHQLTRYEGGRFKKLWLSFLIDYAKALGVEAKIELVENPR